MAPAVRVIRMLLMHRKSDRVGLLVFAGFAVAMIRRALSATARKNLLLFARELMPPCSSSPGRPGI